MLVDLIEANAKNSGKKVLKNGIARLQLEPDKPKSFIRFVLDIVYPVTNVSPTDFLWEIIR